jgi:hypothetical protein
VCAARPRARAREATRALPHPAPLFVSWRRRALSHVARDQRAQTSSPLTVRSAPTLVHPAALRRRVYRNPIREGGCALPRCHPTATHATGALDDVVHRTWITVCAERGVAGTADVPVGRPTARSPHLRGRPRRMWASHESSASPIVEVLPPPYTHDARVTTPPQLWRTAHHRHLPTGSRPPPTEPSASTHIRPSRPARFDVPSPRSAAPTHRLRPKRVRCASHDRRRGCGGPRVASAPSPIVRRPDRASPVTSTGWRARSRTEVRAHRPPQASTRLHGMAAIPLSHPSSRPLGCPTAQAECDALTMDHVAQW